LDYFSRRISPVAYHKLKPSFKLINYPIYGSSGNVIHSLIIPTVSGKDDNRITVGYGVQNVNKTSQSFQTLTTGGSMPFFRREATSIF